MAQILLILFSIRTRRVVSLQILWPSQFTQTWPKRCRVRRHFDEGSCRYPRTLYHCDASFGHWTLVSLNASKRWVFRKELYLYPCQGSWLGFPTAKRYWNCQIGLLPLDEIESRCIAVVVEIDLFLLQIEKKIQDRYRLDINPPLSCQIDV